MTMLIVLIMFMITFFSYDFVYVWAQIEYSLSLVIWNKIEFTYRHCMTVSFINRISLKLL